MAASTAWGAVAPALRKFIPMRAALDGRSQSCRSAEWPSDDLLGAGLKMDLLIHYAVIAGSCVNEYGRNRPVGKPPPSPAVDSTIPFVRNG